MQSFSADRERKFQSCSHASHEHHTRQTRAFAFLVRKRRVDESNSRFQKYILSR